jgi:hypothetical protein
MRRKTKAPQQHLKTVGSKVSLETVAAIERIAIDRQWSISHAVRYLIESGLAVAEQNQQKAA